MTEGPGGVDEQKPVEVGGVQGAEGATLERVTLEKMYQMIGEREARMTPEVRVEFTVPTNQPYVENPPKISHANISNIHHIEGSDGRTAELHMPVTPAISENPGPKQTNKPEDEDLVLQLLAKMRREGEEIPAEFLEIERRHLERMAANGIAPVETLAVAPFTLLRAFNKQAKKALAKIPPNPAAPEPGDDGQE